MSIALYEVEADVVLHFNIDDEDGTDVNITGGSVDLIVQGLADFSCSITGGSTGEAEYTVVAGDFPDGEYEAQLKVLDSAGDGPFYSNKFRLISKKVVNG